MSRLYETLRRMEKEHRQTGASAPEATEAVEMLSKVLTQPVELEGVRSIKLQPSQASRLVALTDPKSLGAEKFRALVTRLENLRFQREFKSLQVTSGGINEGKTTVSANIAVTFAKRSDFKVLLIEGDLHRPTLASLLGVTESRGLVHWWSAQDQEISTCLNRLGSLPLWFLSAGTTFDHPSEILQSPRFAETFTRLASWFDWIVVDSTPMLPTVDANLWSRLVDGSLLVVREGVASIKALKKGLEGLDNPKWIGMVLNEASEFDRMNYAEQYYTLEPQQKKGSRKER
jgi:capsular exopolysaccharide synthesis family protein